MRYNGLNTTRNLDLFIEALPPHHRAAMDRLHPHRIASPGGYTSQLWVKVHSISSIMGVQERYAENRLNSNTGALIMTLAEIAQDCGSPLYWGDKNWLDAVNRTTPPPDASLQDVEIPLPSFQVMLPEAFTRRTFRGWHIPFLHMAYVGDKSGAHKYFDENMDVKVLLLHFPVVLENGLAIDFGYWSKVDTKLADLATDVMGEEERWEAQDSYEQFKKENEDLKEVLDVPVPSAEDEAFFLKEIPSLAVKILMVLNAEPAHRGQPSKARDQRIKKGVVVRDALWNPTWLGKGYQTERVGTGTHASPHMHWRKGHMHTVLSGPGRTIRTLRWFRPVLVNKAVANP